MSDEFNGSEEQEMARAILRYLQAHPEAKDTLDGIAQWWLLREWTERKIAKVERAVSFLLSRNLIFETRTEGLQPYYGLNTQRREDIANILKGK